MVIGLHACQQPVTHTSGKLRVLTTIAPLYSFTRNVVGDLARVDNLIPSGVGPHEYSLSPADARNVAGANVLVTNGINLETWLQTLTSTAEGVRKTSTSRAHELIVVDTSAGIEVVGKDPHIWLSPDNAILQVKNIRDAMINADPDNGQTYRKNTVIYIQRLVNLDNEIRDEIKTWKTKEFVAFHSAFTYFARDYGLEQVAVIQERPEIEPSPKHIAHVIKTIKSKGIRAIFTDPLFSHKIVTSLAKDLNLEIYSLDTLETGSLSKEWYEDSMRSNLAILKKALK
jgi:zinc/manganese transport system substrate-binding protein